MIPSSASGRGESAVGTLVVGVVACHLGAHGGGCSVPSYSTGRGRAIAVIDREAVEINCFLL